ncbi:MAG: DUF2723 domain-containing protein [Candidatus Roizmanbacteria bacterium]|nr:DUF2723 domain-containing protein [Candidatus Roizmanbacteria bacterium]
MIAAFYLFITTIYISLQSRYVFGGDSAEYSTVARTWGIAHPPGYPLYSLLANIIDRIIPFETTSWRISLLSSIPTVLTAYILYKIMMQLKLTKYVALIGSLLYLVLFPIWQYALVPEVFALHTFFVALITYLLLKYIKKPNTSYLLYSSLVCGLCISNHHIFVLFIPGWLFLLKDKIKKIVLNRKLCIQMLTLICLGGSFYLYTIIVSLNNTILDWENAKTIQGFFSLITRSTYGSFKAYSSSNPNIGNQISDILSGLLFILLDFKPLGIIFIIVGFIMSRKYEKLFSTFLFISLAAHFAFLFYTNFILTSTISSGMFERFLIPIYVILIIFLSIGVDYVYKNYYARIVAIIKNPFLKRIVKLSYYIFICLYVLIVAKQNFKSISYISKLNVFEQFGKDIIKTVPHGGILTTQGDTSTFTTAYQVYGLNMRRDVVLFQLGLMHKENYIEMIKKRTPKLHITTPINSSDSFKQFVAKNSQFGYYAERELAVGVWRPYGLVWKYYPDSLTASSDSASLLFANKKLWDHEYKIPLLSADEKNIFHLNSIGEYYLNSYQNYAKLLVYMERYNDAEIVLKTISEKYKQNDPQSKVAYMNILVLENKCIEATKVAHTIDIVSTIKNFPGFVKPALAYLEKCEPQNENIPHFKKLSIEYEKSAKTELTSF